MADVTFKVDNKKIKAGEVRVEVELPDGDSIVVVLTHEGIITDCIRGGEVAETSSIMYSERFDEMVEN